MIPQTIEIGKPEFVHMLDQFVDLILDAKPDCDLPLTSESGWKIKPLFDTGSVGTCVAIEWLQSPDGTRVEPGQLGEWYAGYCDGFVDGIWRSAFATAVSIGLDEED